MRGSKIPLERAAIAIEAVKTRGYTHERAGELANVSRRSVGDILNGAGRWGEYVEDDDAFASLRQLQKKAMQVASFELGRQSLVQAEQSLPKASYLQAVTGYAILRDKERLDAGEPTHIVESVNLHVVTGLDRLAALLSQSLVEERVIDVTPAGQGGNNGGNKGDMGSGK